MRKQIFSLVSLFLAAAAPAEAHDFWLQLKTYQTPVGGAVPMQILVGHGGARERWSGDPARVVLLRARGAAGVVDYRGALRQQPDSDAVLSFTGPGTQVLAFQSTPAFSDLPALRFNDYAKLEGLTPALEYRARTRTLNAPGRETYSRRAKALVQVGPPTAADDRQATTPVGMTLEIVPLKNPYRLNVGETLPVRVLYEGRPLAGALVKLTNLEFDARPVATHLTDGAGQAAFEVPRTGTWLLNVIWTKRVASDPKADFDTTFASLTFAFPSRPYSR